MREIKFRAWDARSKTMFNVDVLAISECAWDCPDHGKQGVSLAYQPSIEVMQFTGLKDNNGVEIYEGDILSFDKRVWYMGEEENGSHIHAVEWSTQEGSWVCMGSYHEWPTYCEVIGNIHENPELLEGEVVDG